VLGPSGLETSRVTLTIEIQIEFEVYLTT
jgi:hypothetical protein